MSGSGGSSGGQSAQSYVTFTISPDPGFTLLLDHFEGAEELGRPFHYDLTLSSEKAKPDLTSLLGAHATIAIVQSGSDKRYFNGVISRATYSGMSSGSYKYKLELRPWIWLLSRNVDCKIFQNKSAWDIITGVFRDAGFSDFEDKRQSQAGETVLDYCVQYHESSLDFVTRLMEQWGIYYYFKHEDGSHKLVMADDPNSHASVGKPIPFYAEETESRRVQDHVWGWASDLALHSGTFTSRDYNFTTPAADLTVKSMKPGQHAHGSNEVYEFPGWHGDPDVGQKLATVRMQDIAARRSVISGASNSRLLSCGCKFTLSGHTEDSQNKEWMLTGVTYVLSMAERLSDKRGALADTFRISFKAIDGATPFRLDRQAPRPVMRGPQTAKVVGQSGEEITTDQYGRVKVQFPWDRVGTNDEKSSCWIRVSQAWAGGAFGGMNIPRVGQEVIVDFLDGNPDRPIITGRVYNASQTVPSTLPDNKTQSTIKTNSSPGGGGSNELRFEDKAGSEELYVHAQKDYNKVVLNNETQKIKQDSTTTVEQGNRSITVSAGNHSLNVSAGKSDTTAAQSITLTVGGCSIKIEPSGITIQAPQIQIQASASMTLNGGGQMTVQAGMVAIN